ncbi:MAG: DUF721 domain-containing protein [Schleiferiaceae bacterium]|nr:DUF721 domain-containing protein [Schleiferiaceae bacterium]
MKRIPSRRSSKEVSIGSAIQAFLKESGLDIKMQEAQLSSYWDQVLSGSVASATQSLKVKDGVLVVRLESSVARKELLLRKAEVIAALNEKMGFSYLTDIRAF